MHFSSFKYKGREGAQKTQEQAFNVQGPQTLLMNGLRLLWRTGYLQGHGRRIVAALQ